MRLDINKIATRRLAASLCDQEFTNKQELLSHGRVGNKQAEVFTRCDSKRTGCTETTNKLITYSVKLSRATVLSKYVGIVVTCYDLQRAKVRTKLQVI